MANDQWPTKESYYHQITGTFQTSMAVVACDQLMGHGFVWNVIYIYIMIYYDLFLNGQAILRYTYQDTASYKIPGPAHRGPQFLAQIACKGGREGAPPNLRFAACKWALIQWIGLRNILQKTIEFTKVGFPVQ
jgi:hypothetical protein